MQPRLEDEIQQKKLHLATHELRVHLGRCLLVGLDKPRAGARRVLLRRDLELTRSDPEDQALGHGRVKPLGPVKVLVREEPVLDHVDPNRIRNLHSRSP